MAGVTELSRLRSQPRRRMTRSASRLGSAGNWPHSLLPPPPHGCYAPGPPIPRATRLARPADSRGSWGGAAAEAEAERVGKTKGSCQRQKQRDRRPSPAGTGEGTYLWNRARLSGAGAAPGMARAGRNPHSQGELSGGAWAPREVAERARERELPTWPALANRLLASSASQEARLLRKAASSLWGLRAARLAVAGMSETPWGSPQSASRRGGARLAGGGRPFPGQSEAQQ